MTREEAAKVLENSMVCCGSAPVDATFEASCDEVRDAMSLAISALRGQDSRTESDTVKGGEIDPLKNGWISVKERLPEPFISVLGHCPDEEPLPTVHECYMNGFGQWMSAQVYGMGNVTHWMPLPEGPDKKLVKNEEQIGGRQC